jgi:tetratricopeptide (TPR) repeat protein
MRHPRVLLPTLGLILASFCAYFPVLRNNFVWDDDYYIQANVQLTSAKGLWHIWTKIESEPQYYPLTHTTFWIEYNLFGANPFPYHLDNLLFHTASTLVFWRLLLRLRIPGAWGAALLFCVHPLQAESVAWATERKNVLSALLYFLSASAYLRTKWGRDDAASLFGWGWYIASLLLFFAAILAKSVVSTLPAAVLLITWWRRGSLKWADVMPLVPMFLAATAMGSLTRNLEMYHVGAVGPDFNFSPLDRIVIAGGAFWFYLWKLIWPVNLSFVYPRWNVNPTAHPWQLLFPLAALIFLFLLWQLRRRWGRGPITAALFFAGTLIPALGFANVFPMRYSFVADHFQYLACIGPIALFCAAAWKLRGRAVVLTLGVLCCIATQARCRTFYDQRTLWTGTLRKNPNSSMVLANYAQTFADAGDWSSAERKYRRALALDPGNGVLETRIAVCRIAQGDNRGAIDWLQQAIRDMPPSQYPVINNLRSDPYFRLGTIYDSMPGQEKAAEDAYRMAIQIEPDYEIALDNLAALLLREGKIDEAIANYQKALEINPDSVPGQIGLGNAYLAQGDFQRATAQYNSVLQMHPDNVNAINNLGDVYARQSKWDQAISQFEAALKIDPSFELAQRNLAQALQKANEKH